MKRFTKALMTTTMAIAAGALIATSAMATDGMYGNGTGARNKALAGSGVADQNDSTAMSINPAGMVHSDNQFSFSASLFSPLREYNVGAGISQSDSEYFVIPNMAWTHRVDGNTVFGLSMYGNGGMNSDYPVNFAGAPNLGIDLQQIFLSAGMAKSYGNISVGLAPILAIQIFSADGVPGNSENTDIAVGVGVRGGVEVALAPNFRVAAAGTTPIYMSAFTSYDQPGQLFGIDEGRLNLPGTVQLGVAFDLMPSFTIMADYKRIFYGSEKVIGTAALAGGFGWSDINIYKFGAEWDINPGFTLRAGYSYNDNPLSSAGGSGFPNVLAPATVQHHFTGGAKVKMTETLDLELAGMYAPEETVSAVAGGASPASTVSMHQFEATVGVIWHLGTPEAPLK